jgi:GT2 family glycosyltransferase
LKSIFTRSTYQHFEVILIDNETTDQAALQTMKQYPIKRVLLPNPFNYSRANNIGASYARGEYLLFLNNDTEVVSEDWLEQLLYYARQPDVGAAGGLLLYPDQTVQHAGIVLGFRGTADHVMRGFARSMDGYAGSLACAREVSGVTAACLMMRRELFDECGGFNEHYFTHYQDVDLCVRLTQTGRMIIYTPRAVLIHHESVTRKTYYDLVDRTLFLDQWQSYVDAGDPFYNPNFDRDSHNYAVKVV